MDGAFQSSRGSGPHHERVSPSSSSAGGRFHRVHSRGSYKQMQERREDWPFMETMVDTPRGGMESPAAATGVLQPWFSRTQSQNSHSTASPAQGGFMLASSISSDQQQYLSHSLSPSSSSSLVPILQPPLPTLSASPSNSSTGPPPSALWGEERDRVGEEGGGGKESGKWVLHPLWQDGWRAQNLVCSVSQLLQHPPLSHSPLEQSNLPSLLDHPRDRRGHNPILHSTDLQQHIREVEHISVMSGTNFAPSDLPPLPERFGSSEVKRTPCGEQLKMEQHLLYSMNLDPTSEALLLRKSAAAVCSHVGYHSASLRALDTLAGVMGDFLSRLSKQLSIHSEQQRSSEPDCPRTNIQDPLERSLWSCGIQGRAGLHRFWRTEVEAGLGRLQRAAAQLHEEPAPSSLPPPPRSLRPLSLSSWPSQDLAGEKVDEELSLEEALATDMSIIAPATTPDPGGVQTFFPDIAGQEPEGFVLLTPDLPPRQRLRTSSSIAE